MEINSAAPVFIELKDISFEYSEDKKIIRSLDLVLEANTSTAITGPNGCGKTTLSKLIMGILKPGSGRILLEGINISELSLGQIGNMVGYLFQNPGLQVFTLSVEEELSFSMRLKGFSEEMIKSRLNEMLKLFGLSHLIKEVPFNLSRGERQRLALASIFINRPRYLILDEPTVGLDNSCKNILMRILIEQAEKGMGMTVISHDEDFVKKTATRILRMEDGRIQE